MKPEDQILDMQRRCDKRHEELGKCITDIKVTLGRMDERMETVFGSLEDGETCFSELNNRIKALENFQNKLKGMWILAGFVGSVIGYALSITTNYILVKFNRGGG